MAIASLQFPPPLRRRLSVAPRDYERRDRAVELYEAGDFLGGVHEALRYLLPALPPHDLSAGPLCFVQGTARVRVRLEDGELVVSSALLALRDETQATALLRYALSRLSATGQLFQPRLRAGVLSLEFSDRMSLLHPLKLIEVLQRLPSESDNNDGWLQQRFAVDEVDREALTALDDAEFALSRGIWSRHWEAVDQLMLESRRRRSVRFLDSLGSWAANQIRYALPLHGSVRAVLNEAADEFTDKDENPNRRDSALAKCAREMRQVSEVELRRCLGHANYAINPLHEGTPALISSMLAGQRLQTSGEMRAAGRYLEAAMELVADYLYLLADHSWPEAVDRRLQAALDESSGRPWREVSASLWNHANQTARQFGNRQDEAEDEEDEHGE